MRANSPIDDFSVLNDPLESEPTQSQKLDPAVKELAKASKTKEGKIILDHLQTRVNAYLSVLKTNDFSKSDNVIALATVIAAQTVIQEFEAVLNDVKVATQAVKEVTKG